MQNKHKQMHTQRHTFNCLMRVISGVLDLGYFEKNIFGHFLAVLGLIKSEDLSEQVSGLNLFILRIHARSKK